MAKPAEARTRPFWSNYLISIRLSDWFFNTASSDSAGRFALEDLEPRAYRLTFQKPAYETETREVTAAEDTDLRVEMRRGEGLGLVALDALFGTPLRRLMVRVVDASGIAVFAGTQKEPGRNISIEKTVVYSDRVEISAILTDPSMQAAAGNGKREKNNAPEENRSRNPVVLFHMEKTALPVTVVWLGSGGA